MEGAREGYQNHAGNVASRDGGQELMSKKDYEKAARIAQTVEDETGRGAIVWAFSRLFIDDSSRFDFERFRRACVPGANVKARKAS